MPYAYETHINISHNQQVACSSLSCQRERESRPSLSPYSRTQHTTNHSRLCASTHASYVV